MGQSYYVYVMGNDRPTLYVGVTKDLIRRVDEHKQCAVSGFTQKYRLKRLLYYEIFSDIEQAILREKRIKKWNRQWKLDLIKRTNPQLKDLCGEIVG